MKTLRLTNHFQMNVTLVENEFIDNYMVQANGEYIKVYLFLLRHINNPYISLTISTMADHLENTEKDIVRALKYWEKEGLIHIEYDTDGTIIGLDFGQEEEMEEICTEECPDLAVDPEPVCTPDPKPAPVCVNTTDINQFKNRKELKSLLFIAEQYLGKTLSSSDVESITYFYDGLHFSTDLIEYLIEYCVENGHKSMHYIQKVALAWSEENISTVEQARNSSALYNKNCYSVLNAFGIKGRGPAAPEIAYIKKWTDEFGFTLDIVIEACNRTMAKLHQPNFEYTDSILKKWKTSGIHHLSDLQRLDQAYRQNAARKSEPKANNNKNKFNNFEGRKYDYDSLEKQLLSQ